MTKRLIMSDEISRHNAQYVRLRAFRWYATWPIRSNPWTMREPRYTGVLGPFWFEWTARRAVRRNIL